MEVEKALGLLEVENRDGGSGQIVLCSEADEADDLERFGTGGRFDIDDIADEQAMAFGSSHVDGNLSG